MVFPPILTAETASSLIVNTLVSSLSLFSLSVCVVLCLGGRGGLSYLVPLSCPFDIVHDSNTFVEEKAEIPRNKPDHQKSTNGPYEVSVSYLQ